MRDLSGAVSGLQRSALTKRHHGKMLTRQSSQTDAPRSRTRLPRPVRARLESAKQQIILNVQTMIVR